MYPTREQILESACKHRPEVVQYVRSWKRDQWLPARRGTNVDRQDAIFNLVNDLVNLCYLDHAPVRVVFDVGNGTSSYYRPSTRTIHLNVEPSIVTALHELAHHLFGASELKACRWSVWLFKKAFPKAYARLAWDGHVLRRPTAAEVALTSPGPRRLALN